VRLVCCFVRHVFENCVAPGPSGGTFTGLVCPLPVRPLLRTGAARGRLAEWRIVPGVPGSEEPTYPGVCLWPAARPGLRLVVAQAHGNGSTWRVAPEGWAGLPEGRPSRLPSVGRSSWRTIAASRTTSPIRCEPSKAGAAQGCALLQGIVVCRPCGRRMGCASPDRTGELPPPINVPPTSLATRGALPRRCAPIVWMPKGGGGWRGGGGRPLVLIGSLSRVTRRCASFERRPVCSNANGAQARASALQRSGRAGNMTHGGCRITGWWHARSNGHGRVSFRQAEQVEAACGELAPRSSR